MDNNICRIAVFYDGTYFFKVSNYYLYQHDRKARLSLSGLHAFILAEVAKHEGKDTRRCQIVDAAYFRGRLTAQQANDHDKLFSDRVFEDVLMRADITMFQQHLSNRPDGTMEEKRIDVWLALEAYEMATLKKYDVCVLITGDGDFVPLVRKLNTIGSRVMLLGWDFSYEKDGRQYKTQVSTGLIDRVNYPIMMNTEIDARERRTDPLIQALFMPRTTERVPEKHNEENLDSQSKESERRGVIVNLDPEKGFGFIKPTGGGDNCFFHVRDLVNATMDNLGINKKVMFLYGRNEKGGFATNVRLDISPVDE